MRLAVCGGKGGCGKTTTALGVAQVLADARRDPVVVDCDRDMPNLHVHAGTPDEPGVDALADGDPLSASSHRANTRSGARVVPAIPGSDVEAALEALPETTTPVILDTPAGASEDVAVPLRAAEASLLVTTPSGPCIRAAVKTAAMARTLDTPPIAAVVSRSDGIPPALPQALGIPRSRVVPVPRSDDPLAADACQPLGRLAGWLRPNA